VKTLAKVVLPLAMMALAIVIAHRRRLSLRDDVGLRAAPAWGEHWRHARCTAAKSEVIEILGSDRVGRMGPVSASLCPSLWIGLEM
jgi:hypothetical protein